MRAIWVFALLPLVGCGGDEEPAFSDQGGTLEIPGCGYSITTRLDADLPRLAGDKLGPNPTPRLVHLGLVGDPRTSIVAQWRTIDETTTAGSIRYAEGADLPASQLTRKVRGIQFGYNATGVDIYRVHQAHVCDLEPGKAYSYQVGHGDHWSPVYTFHTAPDVETNPDTEIVIGFAGDSRGGYDVWAQIVAQLQQRAPDLVLFTGDAVTIGLTQYEWEEFLGVGEPLFATVPVVLTNGNHEANAVNFYSQFALPGDQENFGFSYGFARIFVANDSPEDPNALTVSIPQAIDADFTDHADARWKLLMHHRPMWSSGSRHGSNATLQAAWGPVVDKHRVDLVLNGHEHQYEITKPLAGGSVQATNADGTVYVVAGGAGADLYGFEAAGAWSEYIEKTHTAGIIRMRRTQLTLDAFRADGTSIPAGFTKSRL
jgi:acid phosphatase type 7